uniref:Fatty acid desaturase 6-like n=1 Tax=Saccoglossus kowalevskii TaxID=10224 RepID=A0ABM0GYQ0_SACKO|nr:PREDICTED: fatty acid desaturase 6-like [Saccoglossus kowalevskii]
MKSDCRYKKMVRKNSKKFHVAENGVEPETRNLVKLPKNVSISQLNAQVRKVVAESGWWDLYGVDCAITIAWLLLLIPAFLLMRSDSWTPFIVSHQAVHSALCASKVMGKFWSHFFLEICGAFSVDLASNIHIKIHHPYTNIIGLGDSSSWRAPFLPALTYMFFAPLLFPIVSPLFVIAELTKANKWKELLRCTLFITAGIFINITLLMKVSGLKLMTSLLTMWSARAVLSIPYIHVNIFQHIGLPMYSKETAPKRLHLMSTGVLNLPRNPLLDWTFGHAIVNCHVEHHLFPELSDNMCLKIKPIVSKYLTGNSLPYNEDTYMNRLRMFVNKYEELMVKLPPISEFIGIQ